MDFRLPACPACPELGRRELAEGLARLTGYLSARYRVNRFDRRIKSFAA